MQYRRGDIVYFIQSGLKVIPAQVTACMGSSYTLRFHGMDRSGYSGIRLPADRLFPTEEEAGRHVRVRPETTMDHRDTHWDYRYR